MPCQFCPRNLLAETLHAALQKRYLNPRGYSQPLAPSAPRAWSHVRSGELCGHAWCHSSLDICWGALWSGAQGAGTSC